MKEQIKEVFEHRIDAVVRHPVGGPTLWTIANGLTLGRIFVSPVFLLVYLQYEMLGIGPLALPYVLLALLGIAELSDAFDGYVARKYDQVTDLGRILDPMADSVARITVFLTFTQPPVEVPLLAVFVFLYRDSVTSTLRTVCALRGFALGARASGKVKAILQGVAAFSITLLLIPYSLGQLTREALHGWSTALVWVVGVYSLYSAAEYLYANRAHIKRVLIKRRHRRHRFSGALQPQPAP